VSGKALRLDAHLTRGPQVHLVIDDETIVAYAGETVATVLLTSGRGVFRHTPTGEPRGIFCGIGQCYDCLVTVDGVRNVRACVTPVREGMMILTSDMAASE
jgi:predicted molibdopterin-dependent oxidoreductase YjgC